MAEHKHDDHPKQPGVMDMAWFAVVIFALIFGVVLFLQLKFGTPGPAN
jgi:hypothetical protein